MPGGTETADQFQNRFKDSPEWLKQGMNPREWPYTFAAQCAEAYAQHRLSEVRTATRVLFTVQTDRTSETEWSADLWVQVGKKRELLGWQPCESQQEADEEAAEMTANLDRALSALRSEEK